MADPFDTEFGASRPFPSTHWADILSAADPARAREQLDALIRRYWKPVFAYVRASSRRPVEDAKDITQAFFAHLLEGDAFSKVRPKASGTFRGFLKRAVRNFIVDLARFENVRASIRPVAAIDAARDEGPATCGPEEAYDREWFRGLMEASIAELREFLGSANKSVYFDAFQAYCLDAMESPVTYREVAAKLKLTETDVRHFLEYARSSLRRILRDRIREYAGPDNDLEEELRQALGE